MSEVNTVELAEHTPKVEAPKLPTRDELREKGWSAAEMDSAEKRGMVAKPEEPKKEEPKEEPKPEVKKEEPKPEEKKPAPSDMELTPEQEEAFSKLFPPGTNPRGLYFRMKNERQGRQQAQADLAKEREARIALEARLKALEEGNKAPKVDAEGNPIPEEDPEDRPMTLRAFNEMLKRREEEINKRNAENEARAHSVFDAQRTQEEYVKSVTPDFDKTMELAADVMKNVEKFFPEKHTQMKVKGLMLDLQRAAANADKMDLDERHAPWIAYELGQLHPNYGKTADGAEPKETGTPKDPKANGGLTPEAMKRMEKNTQRGAPSASLPSGGGRRTVSVEDVTAEDLNRMSYKERQTFREKHPARYAKLTRG